MTPFDLFVELLLSGGLLEFLTNVSRREMNQHGSHVQYVMPTAFKLTTHARMCLSVNKKAYAQLRSFRLGSIGIQQILKVIRVDYLRMVDNVLSHCLSRPFQAAPRLVCFLVEIGWTTFTGIPMYIFINDILINENQLGFYIELHDGFVHSRNNTRFRDHSFAYLPGHDGVALPKRISDTDREQIRMLCMDELMGVDGLRRIVGMYVRGLMNAHSTAVTEHTRTTRMFRFLADNVAAIESLANPNAGLTFNPRDDWENLGLEAFCMLSVERLAVGSVWHGLGSDLIQFIGRLA